MDVDGALGAALVDHEQGLTLGSSGREFDIELAASGNIEVVRAKLAVVRSIKVKGSIEDILITMSEQYHLIRPLRKATHLFLLLAIDRNKGNLGLARHHLSTIENELEV